ncbi:putative quinone-oxidoreductase, chloroplastic [Echria macrotheca]|uniref:Quinone-oxidoreductase, chloroplastic n=1 Tax=Echria macrotheca TaxID=438768 RepID=A0AAJ0BE30_9PEZI|nr:putative quinone-oxidoreductase, chloroplastic [Echria macrotheca]
MTLPTTMKAWVVTRSGLHLRTDAPVPTIAPAGHDILIKVTHVALNPVDLHLINNIPSWLPLRRNPTPAADFAGEVVAAGSAVKDLAIGARVCGALPLGRFLNGRGSLAEFIAVPADLVAVQPERLSPGQAAGVMGIAGQTSFIMAAAAEGLGSGQRVLVNGASGGVGSILVQVLKGKGAEVVGVCSGANEAMVKGLGADEVVDYRTHAPLEGYLAERFPLVANGKEEEGKRPLDFIFDCAGSQVLFSQSPKYMRPEGKFISIVGGASQGVVPWLRNRVPTFLGGTPRTFQLLLLLPSGKTAREAAELVNKGVIKEAPIDSEFAFEEADKAFERLGTKHAKGKVIVKVAA